MRASVLVIALMMGQGWHDGLYREPVKPKADEKMDVTAIQEKRKQCVLESQLVSSAYSCGETVGSACPCGHYEMVPYLTCADKSRVLLTAENGTRHCVKF